MEGLPVASWVEVYENQRWVIARGWGAPMGSDPQTWSNADGSWQCGSRPTFVTEGWEVDVTGYPERCDQEGWHYAYSFRNLKGWGALGSADPKGCYVRRRRWVKVQTAGPTGGVRDGVGPESWEVLPETAVYPTMNRAPAHPKVAEATSHTGPNPSPYSSGGSYDANIPSRPAPSIYPSYDPGPSSSNDINPPSYEDVAPYFPAPECPAGSSSAIFEPSAPPQSSQNSKPYAPSAPPPPEHFFGQVPGYEGAQFQNFNIVQPPPPTMPNVVPEMTDEPPPPVYSLEAGYDGAISPEQAKAALVSYCKSTWTYSSDVASSVRLDVVASRPQQLVTVETHTEERCTRWEVVPYDGKIAPGPDQGTPPAPWDIDVSEKFPGAFKSGKVKVEVPFTSTIKLCFNCEARCKIPCGRCGAEGVLRCSSCGGDGRDNGQTCNSCGGKGRRRCGSCSGSGKVECSVCQGRGRLRAFLLLLVRWAVTKDQSLVGYPITLPKTNVEKARGIVIYEDHAQILTDPIPVTNGVDPDSSAAAEKLLEKQRKKVGRGAVVLRERRTVKGVPVCEAMFTHDTKYGHKFFVYGTDNVVYVESFPSNWCTIL
eukprot:comp22609_c0_seq1/m.34705 comp22609_c0_seq1/g.34705  ORF comp22609_c0_seq1/g.34705 comp22609_c0_seq1/m.34705 type:complete len:595 (-) comp22609_c0_seq1:415-2199(-)